MTTPDRSSGEFFAPDLPPIPAPPAFTEEAQSLGITFEPGEVEQLGRYLAVLLDANTRMNLTAIKDAHDAWPRHILDSLTLLPVLAQLPADAQVVDIGSGGGTPALPLAIVMPGVRFTLVEATTKKAAFLRAAVDALGIGNVEVVNDRAETLGAHPSRHRALYDAVTARAVGRLAILAELCVPLVKVGGVIALIKGQKADEELAEAKQALHMLHASHMGTIDTPSGRIVVLEKRRTTPIDYPRKPGEPARSPLGVSKERPTRDDRAKPPHKASRPERSSGAGDRGRVQ